MASYPVADGALAVHDKTLTGTVVDTVTFANDCDRVEVISDGVASLYFTVDGSTPTVGGAATYKLPAGGTSSREVPIPTAGGTVVKLISSGAPAYSVTRIA